MTYVNLDSGHRALTQGDVTWVKREVTYVANLPRVTQISLAAPPRVSRRRARGGVRVAWWRYVSRVRVGNGRSFESVTGEMVDDRKRLYDTRRTPSDLPYSYRPPPTVNRNQ